jgi:hypothetical protein
LLKAKYTLVICTIEGVETEIGKIGIQGAGLVAISMGFSIEMVSRVGEFELV